jgi:hypothetical protein
MLDFRIELSHFADRTLPWQWATYNPQRVEMTLHCNEKNYETPAAALRAALEYMVATRAG